MDHKKSITNRIEQIRKNYEKNKNENNPLDEKDKAKDQIKQNKINLVGRNSVYDKVRLIESQVIKSEAIKKEQNFSKLTEKFGLSNYSFNKQNSTTIPENFLVQEQIKNEGKKNTIFESEESVIDFLSQAKLICEDYEREISSLRNKLSEIKPFKDLQISEKILENNNISNTNFFFVGSTNNYFISKLETLSKEGSPDFVMLNTVYSEKITELFLENEKLENNLKSYNDQADKISELQTIIEDLKFQVKDKEIYIQNMNEEIYANKFTDVFEENDLMKKKCENFEKEIEKNKNLLQNKITDFEDFKIKHLSEIDQVDFEKGEIEEKLQERISELKNIKEDFIKEKLFHEENYNSAKQQIEKIYEEKNLLNLEIKKISEIVEKKNLEISENAKDYLTMKNSYEALKLDYSKLSGEKDELEEYLQKKIEDLLKKDIENSNDLLKIQNKLDDTVEEMERRLLKKDIELSSIKTELEKNNIELNELKENVKNSEKENKNNEKNFEKNSEEIQKKDNQIKNLQEENSELNLEYTKLKKKSKENEDELDNLRDIITKDQVRIKELKDFKQKALEGIEDLSLFSKDSVNNKNLGNKNNPENLNNFSKEEFNNLNEKLKEEISKNIVLCEEFRKLQENISKQKQENIKNEKIIEANIKNIDELKIRLKNKIKLDEIKLQSKNDSSNQKTNNYICTNCKGKESISQRAQDFVRNRSQSIMNPNLNLSDDFIFSEKSENFNKNKINFNNEKNNSYNQINSNNNSQTKATVTFEQFNFSKNLIVENLLLNYQLSQSISLNLIVEIILKNFNFFLDTIFDNTNNSGNTFINNTSSTDNTTTTKDSKYLKSSTINTNNNKIGFNINQISILHEFLEEIILKIYDMGIKNKNENFSVEKKTQENLNNLTLNNKNRNNSGVGNKKESLSHHLSKEDFSFDLIKKITSEISEKNILNNLIISHKPNKPSINELFSSFISKYNKYFDFQFLNVTNNNTKYYEIIDIKLPEYLDKEIKPVFIDALKNYSLNNKNKFQILTDKIIQNFQDGFLLNNSYNPVYNFKDFYREYSGFNIILRNSSHTEKDLNISDNKNVLIISDILNPDIKSPSCNTMIINLSNVDGILTQRHYFDYFNFLIKNHTGEITKIIFKGDIKKTIDTKNFQIFLWNLILYNQNLSKLTINDIYLSSESNIREIERLRRMSIYKEPINESLKDFVDFLNNSHNLKYLNLSNCSIGDEGLKHLSKNINNINLKELNLTKNNLKSNSGFYLAELINKMPKLEKLILSENEIIDSGFTELVTAISCLSNYKEKNFKFLDFSKNNLLENEFRGVLDFLVKYEGLESLDLSGNSIELQSSNSLGIYLRLCKGLNYINLSKCELDADTSPLLIKNIGESLVENIVLDYNPIGEIGGILLSQVMKVNKNLKILSVRSCGITGMSANIIMKSLDGNETLMELDMRENNIDNQIKLVIKKMAEDKRYKIFLDE